jgi:hypothetical protein
MNIMCIKIPVGNGPRAVPLDLGDGANALLITGTPRGAFPTDNRFWI